MKTDEAYIKLAEKNRKPDSKILHEILKLAMIPEEAAFIAELPASNADLAAKLYAAKYHSAFCDIHIGGDDLFFVTTWRKREKNFIGDVFDKDGHYLAEIVLPSRRVFFTSSHLYTIEEDADGYPIIKRYAMVWTQGGER